MKPKSSLFSHRSLILSALLTLLFGVGLTQFAAGQFSGPAPDPPPLRAGVRAPSFVSTTLAHTTFRSSLLKGHVAVIDFWATWCPTCKSAMPGLEKLYRHYGPKGVRFIGMSLDTDAIKKVGPVSRSLGVTYTITADPSHNVPTGYAFNAQQLPCVYLLDKRGIVRWSCSGYTDDTRGILDTRIRGLLKEN